MEGRLWRATMVLLWGSAAAVGHCGQHPVRGDGQPDRGRTGQTDGTPQGTVLWWALALGADLGGNATAIGASANVVMLGLAERAGSASPSGSSPSYGLIVTVITVAICVPYLYLRFF